MKVIGHDDKLVKSHMQSNSFCFQPGSLDNLSNSRKPNKVVLNLAKYHLTMVCDKGDEIRAAAGIIEILKP